jgi:exoribonuclease R
MSLFKIQYDDTETWYAVDSGTLATVQMADFLSAIGRTSFDPYAEKIFNQDIVGVGEKGGVVVVASLLRNQKTISGVLVLEKNIGHGRLGKRVLYKCVPDDRRLPTFLVPYSLDVGGFAKKWVNKYVAFKFKEWVGEKPVGELVVTIGDVNVLENFYEYQLYCKNLNASIQDFVAETKNRFQDKSHDAYIESISATYGVEDRTLWPGIYSIDPVGSKDFDDAFGLSASAVDGCVRLSVYISNVALWMDGLRLWSSFSQRISTIYLPDRKRPMLPSVLSDVLCSLLEGKVRFAFVMEMDVCEETGEIVGDVMFKNVSIKVERNFRYDEPDLEANSVYQRALRLVKNMSPKEDVGDSHDFVAYLMVLMNYKCAVRFAERKNGIYRSFKFKSGLDFPVTLPKDVLLNLKLWHSNGSSYIKYDGEKVHHMLKFNEYVHITSPIRRLVDLLNIIQMMDNEGLVAMTGDMRTFYERWTSDESLAYVNQSMRAIRRVQNDCALLAMCTTKPDVMDKEYEGFVFEAMERNDGLWMYVVYVPELKLSSKFIHYVKMDMYSQHKFKIYLFEDNDALKKKIRMEKVS